MGIFQEVDQLNVLIIGASGGIGGGFVKFLQQYPQVNCIFATYYNSDSSLINYSKVNYLKIDVTKEEEICRVFEIISRQTNRLHLVINCVGILQDNLVQPEKSLRQINAQNLLHYFAINSIPTLIFAQYLLPFFKHNQSSIFATISAKVGSIGDNRLGGWYGYRGSKAALNMFMRNIAIEYSRKSPKTCVVSLHPGTTDTKLSLPFQKNVPPEKLFSVDKTVSQLLSVIGNLTINDSGQFFSYNGDILPW